MLRNYSHPTGQSQTIKLKIDTGYSWLGTGCCGYLILIEFLTPWALRLQLYILDGAKTPKRQKSEAAIRNFNLKSKIRNRYDPIISPML